MRTYFYILYFIFYNYKPPNIYTGSDMQEIIHPYLTYLAPPIIGAFIGYLTNKIAIKMLFRPLTKRQIFGFRIPMTPGVIPAKRHELALNMGQMVGEHLLTSDELGKAVQKDDFQKHLLQFIQIKTGQLMEKELGSLNDLIPKRFFFYMVMARPLLIGKITEKFKEVILSDTFAATAKNEIEKGVKHFLNQDINSLAGGDKEQIFLFLDSKIEQLVQAESLHNWLEKIIKQKIYFTLQQGRSLADLMPDEALEIAIEALEEQVPQFLDRLAAMTAEPVVRDKIIAGVKEGVASFIESLGPMAAMAGNFITMELVEEKVREYLILKEESIKNGLQQDEIKDKITNILKRRLENFFREPLVNILPGNGNELVEKFGENTARKIIGIFKEKELSSAISSLLRERAANYFDLNPSIEQVLLDLFGEQRIRKGENWLAEELINLTRSEESIKTAESAIEKLVGNLLNRPIGRLARFIPAMVREDLCIMARDFSSNLLAAEMPGIVRSLNIQNIVTEKIDSLDLLHLEKLLLSIMEEQFKYINLFGALLGFIIGCVNLLIILV